MVAQRVQVAKSVVAETASDEFGGKKASHEHVRRHAIELTECARVVHP